MPSRVVNGRTEGASDRRRFTDCDDEQGGRRANMPPLLRTDCPSQSPRWETILDVDALADTDKKNWVLKRVGCLPPEERLCLLNLSEGGKDAVFVREFDAVAKTFVTNGFALPEGKQQVTWVNSDTVLITRDWGEGTMTQAGYPFVVKELKRAQSLAEAREVFRGEPTDVEAKPFVLRDSEGTIHATGAVRRIGFFEHEYVLFGSKPINLNLPKKATIGGIASGRLLMTLNGDWMPPSGDTPSQPARSSRMTWPNGGRIRCAPCPPSFSSLDLDKRSADSPPQETC